MKAGGKRLWVVSGFGIGAPVENWYSYRGAAGEEMEEIRSCTRCGASKRRWRRLWREGGACTKSLFPAALSGERDGSDRLPFSRHIMLRVLEFQSRVLGFYLNPFSNLYYLGEIVVIAVCKIYILYLNFTI